MRRVLSDSRARSVEPQVSSLGFVPLTMHCGLRCMLTHHHITLTGVRRIRGYFGCVDEQFCFVSDGCHCHAAGHSQAVRQDALMNAIAAEMAIRLEFARAQLVPEHLQDNVDFSVRRPRNSHAVYPRYTATHHKSRSLSFWTWLRSLARNRRGLPLACGLDDCITVADQSSNLLVWLSVQPPSKEKGFENKSGRPSDALS